MGLIEFDKVGHHCSDEVGTLESPAVTAAYLLNCTLWDKRVETYLRNTFTACGHGGGVRNVLHTYVFEIS